MRDFLAGILTLQVRIRIVCVPISSSVLTSILSEPKSNKRPLDEYPAASSTSIDAGMSPEATRPQKRKKVDKNSENNETSDKPQDAETKWSDFTTRYRRYEHQQYFFLAGFSRGRYVKFPKIKDGDIENTLFCEIKANNGLFYFSSDEDKMMSPNELLYVLGKDCLGIHINEESMHSKLKQLAIKLCNDESVAAMFGLGLKSLSEKPKSAAEFVESYIESKQHLEKDFYQLVVGFDWFGDEFGHPFCLFSHSSFVKLVLDCTAKNSKFGIRVHAGEGLIRPSSSDSFDSPASIAFSLHMYVLMQSMRQYIANFEKWRSSAEIHPNIRIGHGVAFLYGLEQSASERSPLARDVAEFRIFLTEKKIVCELNPTSNHMLLPDTFSKEEGGNFRTLQAFLRSGLPVVLCTDDDGIWALNKCVAHHQHISVSHEYCAAIQNDGVNRDIVKQMLRTGHEARFRLPRNKNRAEFSEHQFD